MTSRSSAPQGEGDDKDYNRPRRPEPDTISYLKSLPLEISVAHEEISQFLHSNQDVESDKNNEAAEYPSTLAAALSALEEIRQEVASLAGDERGAEVLEVLIQITAPYSITASYEWLAACQGYMYHLALHRYGSHVLQTILEQIFMVHAENQTDLALHPDSPFGQSDEETSSQRQETRSKNDLWEMLEQLQQELLPFVSTLTTHLCATHVLRSIFLILGGIELVHDNNKTALASSLPRRGKSKKGKKKKHNGELAQVKSIMYSKARYIDNGRRPVQSTGLVQALGEWTDAIAPPESTKQPGLLQQLACHSSGGPLLIVLLRSLTYQEADRHHEQKDMAPAEAAAAKSLGKLMDEPKFHPNGKAHALAQRIICWQDEEEKRQEHAEGVLYGLAGETRGSHVLDTIFRLCPDTMHAIIVETGNFLPSMSEYVEHDVSNFVVQTILATVRTVEMMELLVQACTPLIESGLIVEASNRRRGILWRLTEAVVRFQLSKAQGGILQSLKSHCPLNQLASSLLEPKLDHDDNDRLLLNVEGSRALHYLMQFECNGCSEIMTSVVALPVDHLDGLARDGLGSRCVWDALLQPGIGKGKKGNEARTKTLTKLLKKLQGRWVSLATDRVGRHVVQNLFRQLPNMQQREEMVEELAQGRSRLQGNAMGRAIISECALDVFRNQGSVEWSHRIQKRVEQEDWLEGLLGSANKSSNKSVTDSTNDDSQLSRKEGKVNTSSEFERPTKRSKGEMTVDSIFNSLTMPGKNNVQ